MSIIAKNVKIYKVKVAKDIPLSRRQNATICFSIFCVMIEGNY